MFTLSPSDCQVQISRLKRGVRVVLVHCWMSSARSRTHHWQPAHWPADVHYISDPSYHSSVPPGVRSYISGTSPGTNLQLIRAPIAVRAILEPSHPAKGQYGLFATKKISPRTHILDYTGEVHCDDRPNSDYDLSLYRSLDGVSVGVDACRMGNEARFINDFRGIKPKPNAVFEERRSANGELRMSVWSGSEIIKKGDEILVSYGKSWWRARLLGVAHLSVASEINRSSSQVMHPSSERAFHASASCSSPKDPYQVLGIKKDATPAEIKKVYFSLARKYHPDTNPDKNAQDKFVEIQEAYDILKDEKKRADYDKYGAASQQQGFDANAFENARSSFGGGFGGFQGGFQDFSSVFGSGRGGGGNEQLFEQLFGAFSGRGRTGAGFTESMHGGDLEASLGVSFMEACKGTSHTINITPVVNCGTCSGTGLKAGAKRSTCTSCGGSGTQTFVIDNGFHMASTCSKCHGSGTTVPRGSQCGECAGAGQVRVRKSVKVDVPAGVEDGMTIKVRGAGDAPLSGKGRPGDLLVRIHVASSKVFRRQGPNIHHDARIPLHTALLGGRVRVPTLDGEVDVRIPGGTQQGEEMVLKGRGVASMFHGSKGDLFVTFNVQLPRSLTKRQREILQQYADDVEGRAPSTQSQGTRGGSATESGTSSGGSDSTPSDSDTNEDSSDFNFCISLSISSSPMGIQFAQADLLSEKDDAEQKTRESEKKRATA
ncbi:DnaJ 1, mitochondrial [Grifola frondosa]|uniref:DnaJ homolog 1, mitochondrial n=1 Tax=Grifola frondosa TaxID=5627 RepID=A0A1C7MQP8_GRIFR|nr:DnaJ 1, mitochondrial [Grifola frondosa]